VHHSWKKRADLTNKQDITNFNITTLLSISDNTLINGDFAYNNVSKTMQNVIAANPSGVTTYKMIKCLTTCPVLPIPDG